MSLDVWLKEGDEREEPCPLCGGTGKVTVEPVEVFEYNITHNVNDMADEAGIYKCLWHPEESSLTHARQLIEPLRAGLERLRADPARFRALNPPNGCGSYEGLVEFVQSYLRACEDHPDTLIDVSR